MLTAKFVAVLGALLWGFHNAASGRCFPSYERIAERADCAGATVYEAIHALERAGILTWVNRIARIREWGPDLFGRAQNRWRVIRTSATPTRSSIRNRQRGRRILLSPNFRLEPQTKSFSLVRGGRSTLKTDCMPRLLRLKEGIVSARLRRGKEV